MSGLKRVRRKEVSNPETYDVPAVYTVDLTKVPKDPGQWRSLAEQVAEHRIYKKNEFCQFLKDVFKTRRHLWTVDRYFPYSKGGGIYMDEPRLEPEIRECEEKALIFKSIGLRYTYIAPGMTYEDVMMKLQGIT